MLWAGLQYWPSASGPVTSNLAEAGGFWWADRGEAHPDIQFHFLPGAGLEAGVPPVPGGYGCTINSCHPARAAAAMCGCAAPTRATAPEVDPNYWAEPYDLEMLAARLREDPRDRAPAGAGEISSCASICRGRT